MRRDAFKWAAEEVIGEQMKLEDHEQAQRHREEEHKLKMQVEMQKQQLKLELEKHKLETARAQAQQKLTPPETPEDINHLRDLQAQQQQYYRQNLIPKAPPKDPFAKRAEAMYADPSAAPYGYEDPSVTEAARNHPDPIMAAGLGGLAGGATAHFVIPTQETKHYRQAMKEVAPHAELARAARAAGKKPTKILISEGGKYHLLPADEAHTMLKTLAYSKNAKRLLGGTAAGAGAGILASMLMDNP